MRPHTGLAFIIIITLLLAACTPGAATPTPTPLGSGGVTGPSAGEPASGAPTGPVDETTGLTQPSLVEIPSGVVIPPTSRLAPASDPEPGTATIAIGGGLPLTVTGGTCSMLDGETYVSVPATFDADPPYASLVIYAASDDSNLRGGTLVWATSEAATDSALVSTQDLFVITLNADGFSGRFDGTAHRVSEGIPVQEVIDVSGVFNCIAGLVRVGGEHPVDLTGAQCETTPSIVVQLGRPGENAVLLVVEEGASPSASARGGLSWRVGGVDYTTNWLSVSLNRDAISGSYYGEARRPDGSTFTVEGTFNCLGR